MNLGKLKIYTFTEAYQLLRNYIGSRLQTIGKGMVAGVPKGLREFHSQVDVLYAEGMDLIKSGGNIVFEYKVGNVPFNFSLQKDSSDLLAFQQIILNKEYRLVIDVLSNKGIKLETMVDAGANIGLTSMFFKAYYPDLRIIALEPNGGSYERLKKNVKKNNLKGIIALRKGLWGYSTYLSHDTSFRDGLDWGFRLKEAVDGKDALFEAASMPDIMHQHKLDVIDLVKVDIEGGEASVFSEKHDLDWLKKVKVLAIEIHDEFDCRMEIENMLSNRGYIILHGGELTLGVNQNLLLE